MRYYGTACPAPISAERGSTFLVWHQVEFPKTHDIRHLTALVDTVDSGLADLVREASALSAYAIEARYPSDLPQPTFSQARDARAIAVRVRDAVLARLAPVLGSDPAWHKEDADE
jgi:HEPN domain